MAVAQVNAQNIYVAIEDSTFDKKLENEDTRMKAYWELHVVANNEVSDQAYRFIHEFKAYITLLRETTVAAKVLRHRITNPDAEDSQHFLSGIQKFIDENDLENHGVATKGYELLMVQVHTLVDAMRKDLGLGPVGVSDGSDLRSNPIENWLTNFRRSLPEGKFRAPEA